MKKSFSKIGFYLMLVLATATISCDNDDDDDNGSKEPTGDELTLQGDLTGERKLLTGYTYTLKKTYTVKDGAKLIIEPGVTILAESDGTDVDYIIVAQGGKIEATGTKDKPIVMTSTNKVAGAWGGLHICGKAPINLGAAGKSEFGELPYGGTNAADNSGIIKYVRLEYTGFRFNGEIESNGLTLYGVGNGTTIEYVQIYKGSDDGFEWFGGTVNTKYLVSTDSDDDSFDWTQGWSGKNQFWLAVQGTPDGDCLIEADNLSNNFAATPVSNPTIANVTLIGNNSTAQNRGIRLRAGTKVQLYNVLVTNKANSLTTETPETGNALLNGNSNVEYVYADKVFAYKDVTGLDLVTKPGNAINQTITFTNKYVGTVDGGKDLSTDAFFAKALYKGAVPTSNDWTTGWTR